MILESELPRRFSMSEHREARRNHNLNFVVVLWRVVLTPLGLQPLPLNKLALQFTSYCLQLCTIYNGCPTTNGELGYLFIPLLVDSEKASLL